VLALVVERRGEVPVQVWVVVVDPASSGSIS
jgi:hypothetical protein